MKRVFTNIFVFLVNFYLISFLIGMFLVLISSFIGPLNIWFGLACMLLSLGLCIYYQFNRDVWDENSIGEVVVGSESKDQILIQTKQFSITRIPIFVLILIILGLNNNLFDGLSEGHKYGILNAVFFGIVLLAMFFGLANFFIKPNTLSIIVFSSGLIFLAFMYKHSDMFYIYMGLTVIWFLTGLYYKSKYIKPQIVDEPDSNDLIS